MQQVGRGPDVLGRELLGVQRRRGVPLGQHLRGQLDPGRERAAQAVGVPQLAGDHLHAGPVPQPVVRPLLHRHAGPGQRVHDRPGLRVGAVEHRDVRERQRARRDRAGVDPARVQRAVRQAADQLVDGTHHEVGLVGDAAGEVAADQRRLRVEPGRVEPPAADQRGRRDGLHGGGQDRRRRAVVAGQPDQPGVGEVLR